MADEPMPMPAQAQTTAPSAPLDPWHVAVGPGIYVAPRYPGSSQLLVFPIVYQDIDYRGRFFSRGFDFLGVYAVNNVTVQAGADFQLDPTWRHSSDAPKLARLDNVDPTVRARAFVQATYSLATLSVDLAQDIAGQRQGLLANVDLLFSAPLGQWLLSVGPGTTWADSTYMQTFFGISPAQAGVSGLPVHPVDSGLREWHVNLYATGKISQHWSAALSVTYARLIGDAASSPVTSGRGQLTTMAALTWQFR